MPYAKPSWKTGANWEFVKGDIRVSYETQIDQNPPDYLFLDSFHSAEFGTWYRDTFFPLLRQKSPGHVLPVSLHDVYNPGFWTDGPNVNLRKTANLPTWMPNEEGLVIIEWAAFAQDEVCCLFTVAPSKNPILTQAIFKGRTAAFYGKERVSSDPKWHDQKKVISNSPTLYFDLLH